MTLKNKTKKDVISVNTSNLEITITLPLVKKGQHKEIIIKKTSMSTKPIIIKTPEQQIIWRKTI